MFALRETLKELAEMNRYNSTKKMNDVIKPKLKLNELDPNNPFHARIMENFRQKQEPQNKK